MKKNTKKENIKSLPFFFERLGGVSLFIAGSLFIVLIIATNVFYVYVNISGLEMKKTITYQKKADAEFSTSTDTFRMIDGVRIAGETPENFVPFAVMIDNSSDARNIYGLDSASMVYETISESSITRYLAIFDYHALSEKIGPVRSARPYFVDWAKEWGSVFFHSGGSPQALEILDTWETKDIDEISADGIYFWRDKKYKQPHNLFTSAQLMRKAVLDKNIDLNGPYLPWIFKEDSPYSPQDGNRAKNIIVDFSVADYEVEYQYEAASNSYQRYLNAKPHATQDGKPLYAKNIVIQYVQHKVIDDLARIKIINAGSGDAAFFIDGIKKIGSWQTQNRRTRFYDDLGNEMQFNRGTIWIEVIFDPSQLKVE